MSAPAYAAVDWGTSSFRAWLIGDDGGVLGERRSGEGMLSAEPAGFSAILEKHLADMGAPESLPAVICGMAGARQGWIEARYVSVPAKLSDIFAASVTVPGTARPVRIVPGLALRDPAKPDVMRGEETQLAGLARIGSGHHIVCMPGTHSKWVELRDGAVLGFHTWMTGELFSVLSKQSILRHSLGEAPAAAKPDDAAFLDGCRRALDAGGDLGPSLFGIRAATLLHDAGPEASAGALSGLLIGAEIASARKLFDETGSLILVGSGGLGRLYEAALKIAGYAPVWAGADDAVRAGLAEAARHLGFSARAAA